MSTEKLKEQFRAYYYRNLEANREKARLRAAAKRAGKMETPEEAEARRQYAREYYAANREHLRTLAREYEAASKPPAEPKAELTEEQKRLKQIEYKRQWREKNRDRLRVQWRADYHKHREKILAKEKAQRLEARLNKPAPQPKPPPTPEQIEEKRKKYRMWAARYRSNPENREKINEKKRMYSVKLLEMAAGDEEKLKELRAKRRASNFGWIDRMKQNDPTAYAEFKKARADKERERRKRDPQRRIACILRTKMYIAIRRQQKGQKAFNTEELTGCTVSELMKHIESKWQSGMDWSNFGRGVGKWTLDHEQPCASVDLSDPENQKKVFHYSNINPTWFSENCSKNSRYQGRRWRHSDHACQPPPTV